MPNYGPKLFTGTAEYYAKYRAKYPAVMFADVVDYFGLNGRGNLLDLGCGTGELAIPLAKYFENVLGLDPEPEMLEQATIKSKRAGTYNIDWQIGSSKTLNEVNKVFKLITIGQAFHWMANRTILNELYDLIEPAGGLCIAGAPNSMNLPQNKITGRKDELIRQLLNKYIGPGRRAGNSMYKQSSLNWEKDLFLNSKFSKFERRIYKTKVVRNAEQELGNLYSMSWARREYFGTQRDQFEAEFMNGLSTISGHGKYTNQIEFESYFLAK